MPPRSTASSCRRSRGCIRAGVFRASRCSRSGCSRSRRASSRSITVISALTTGMVIIQSFGGIAALFALRARAAGPRLRTAVPDVALSRPGADRVRRLGCDLPLGGPWAIGFGSAHARRRSAVYLVWARGARCVAVRGGRDGSAARARLRARACRGGAASRLHAQRDRRTRRSRPSSPSTASRSSCTARRSSTNASRARAGRPRCASCGALGINTIDLYVMWNWHELADGDFDFTGRTNPRRDLREVLRARPRATASSSSCGPGPSSATSGATAAIPRGCSSGPKYDMPLHDCSKAAIRRPRRCRTRTPMTPRREWLANATHVRYARALARARARASSRRSPTASSPCSSTTIRAPISTTTPGPRRTCTPISNGCATSCTASTGPARAARSSTRTR